MAAVSIQGVDLTTIPSFHGYGMAWPRLGVGVSNAAVTGAAYIYDMRGWDTGSGGRWVYWTSFSSPPDTNPAVTTPAVTGSLSHVEVIGFRAS